MTTKVWCITRNSDAMAHARWNGLLTTGTDVVLPRFIRLDAADLNWAVQFSIPEATCHVSRRMPTQQERMQQ